jgi:hypothetical protein
VIAKFSKIPNIARSIIGESTKNGKRSNDVALLILTDLITSDLISNQARDQKMQPYLIRYKSITN